MHSFPRLTPVIAFPDFLNLDCRAGLPIQVGINLDSVDAQAFNFGKRHIPPLSHLVIIVEDAKAPHDIFAIILSDEPVRAEDEEVLMNDFLFQRHMFGFIQPRYLCQLLNGSGLLPGLIYCCHHANVSITPSICFPVTISARYDGLPALQFSLFR